MKKIFKVLTLGAAMGAGVAGFMHGQNMGTPGVSGGYGDISRTQEEIDKAWKIEQRRREREAGQGNWVQKIETQSGAVFVIQIDGKIYIITPQPSQQVEIVPRETSAERIAQINRIIDNARNAGRMQ
jgi:hypothetical protein